MPELKEKKEKEIALIPKERLQEILNILFPYGYSHYKRVYYTGVSPFIGDRFNIITIIANDPKGWGSVFAICMDRFDEDSDENDSLGFYKGIMKLLMPELHSEDEKFKEHFNVLDFHWASEAVKENAFPVNILLKITKDLSNEQAIKPAR